MPDPKQPPKPRSTEEILREMEAMSKGVGTPPPPASPFGPGKPASPPPKEEGALKSLLGFFVKIVPEEDDAPAPKITIPAPAPPPAGKPGRPERVTSPPPSMPASVHPTIPPRTGPRVADLVMGEPAPKFASPETNADDLSTKSFEEIYLEAGISDSLCSVNDLEKLLENPTVANQPMSVKTIAVNLTLSAKGIGPDVPIADAVRRDRALDAYQEMLHERARTAEQRNNAKIQQITQETEEYLKRKQAEVDSLRGENSEVKRQSVDFALRREVEEKRMANCISPFLQGKPNPVTIGNQPGEPAE